MVGNTIDLTKYEWETVEITLVGDSPLIVDAWWHNALRCPRKCSMSSLMSMLSRAERGEPVRCYTCQHYLRDNG